MSGAAVQVTEFTDPLCPWAWGAEPVLRRLRHALDGQASWRRVFGILFDEDEEPAPDPAAETRWYAGFVAEVCGHTGAPRPERLERVALSSWPASLTARAAQEQGEPVAEGVLRRLRESVFLLGTPADTWERALAMADGVAGLDAGRLARDARSPRIRAAVESDRAETRRPPRELLTLHGPGPHPGRAKESGGGHRFALPTVRFTGPGGTAYVPGRRPYAEYLAAVRRVAPGVRPAAEPPSPAAALERYRSLTAVDVSRLTDGGGPPPDAVRVECANSPVWLHPQEARSHPLLRASQVSANETSQGIH